MQHKYITVGTGTIEIFARALELPLLVRSVRFFFIYLSPLNPKGEILDVLAPFSIVSSFYDAI